MNGHSTKRLRKVIEFRHKKILTTGGNRQYFVHKGDRPKILYAETMRREYKWLKQKWQSLPRKERRRLLCLK